MSLSLILPPPRHTVNDDVDHFNVFDKKATSSTQPPSSSSSSSSFLSIHAEPLSSMQTAVAIRPAPIQAVNTMPSTRASSSSASMALALAAQRRGDPAAVIAGQNRRSNEVVQSSYDDMTEHVVTDEELRRPSDAAVAETIAKTQAALTAQVDKAIAVARPNHVAIPSKEATFVRYMPSEQQLIRPFEQRIIRIQDAPIDPLVPPLFKYKKLPQRPPSPPVPILRSPPRKATKEELKQWDIPPCVSGWKNPHGYVIPLDKRMANDATALIDHSVSDKFAEVSEALYIAERTMRKEIEQRAQLMKIIRQNEATTANTNEQTALPLKQESVTPSLSSMPSVPSTLPKLPLDSTAAYDVTVQDGESDDEDTVAVKKSSQYTSRPLTSAAPQPSLSANPSRTNRDNDRDVSEQMALGQVVRPVATGDQTLFDTRLFNQSAGMGSGFTSDETYSLYDKPLFSGSSANVSYRPRPVALDDDNAASNGAASSLTGRAKPIEFEREADPFGLSALFEDASGGAPRPTSLDQVGKKRGQMAASAGSAGRSSSDRAEDELINRATARSNSTNQRKMDFVGATEPTSIGTSETVRAGLRFTSSSPLPPPPAAPLPTKDASGHIHSDRLHLFDNKQSASTRSKHSDDQRRDDDVTAHHRRNRREGDNDCHERSDYRRSKSPRRRQSERDDGRDEFGRDRKVADERRHRRRESNDSDDDRHRSRSKRSRHSR